MAAAASRQRPSPRRRRRAPRPGRGAARRRRGRGSEVLLRHQVRVDVVVGDRAVLVGPGDPVDAEPALGVVVAERAPQPRRLDQQFQPDASLELDVAGGVDVADDRVGDVGVDVEGRGPGRPVARALLPGDGPPRERGTLQAELAGPVPASRQGASGASAARRRRPAGRCRSGPAARRSRCPRRRGRRSRGRSAPWPGWPGPRPGPRPGGRGTGRSAPPAGSRRRRRPRRRRRSQKSSR